MPSNLRIAINGLGGDDPTTTIRGAYKAALAEEDIEVVLYLDSAGLEIISALPHEPKNLIVKKVEDGKDLAVALADLRARNTNALITLQDSRRLAVNTQKYRGPTIVRAGLLSPMPTKRGLSYILDVGATDRVTDPAVFEGWAEEGIWFLRKHRQVASPVVGLWNIASERAYSDLFVIHKRLRERYRDNYIGFVEAKNVFAGEVDLCLTEGFMGNSILKTVEAFGLLTAGMSIAALSDYPEAAAKIKAMYQELLSYDAHLISPFLGVGMWVFRVHGAADSDQIARAFRLARTNYRIHETI